MPTVLISGASRGLGLEFVRQYAGDGWNVIAACRNPPKAEKLQTLREKNQNIHIENLDVANIQSIHQLAKKLQGTSIDVLINNAGIYSGGETTGVSPNKIDASQNFGTIDVEAWDKVLRINSIAPILMTEVFVPHIAAGQQKKIINITSKMGSLTEMGSSYIAYRTSKTALNAAMKTISHDLKQQNITIINMHPGWVKTDMGGPEATLEPPTSITGMRKVIAGLTLKQTGQFFNYDGTIIPW